ncbi:MAG: hypothetical protein EON88_19810 [Brevundimonas sp.]|nr:MAG: hypothetical protein EON88_19810 [Brevundimonas sp.]
MSQARYTDDARPSRSFLDRLADKAPASVRTQAGALALAADKTVTALEKAKTAAGPRVAPAVAHVRRNRVPYVLGVLALGIGAGLLLHRPSREKAAEWAGEAVDKVRTSFGDQLARELRSLFGR